MNKQQHHRPASTPEQKRQAVKVALLAVGALIVMVLLCNPWNSRNSESQSVSSSDTTSSSSTAKKQSSKNAQSKDMSSTTTQSEDTTSLEDKAQGMFTGDAPAIANEVRALLNAPEDSNVDSLSNLLYRHEHQDLAEASDVYDAIGREQPVDTIRGLAREWYPKAMRAAIEARSADITSSLDGAKRAADNISKLTTASLAKECSDLSGAVERAKNLIDSKSDDYDALTQAQQDLTSAMSGCATELNETDRTSVFGQPQGSKRTGTEE